MSEQVLEAYNQGQVTDGLSQGHQAVVAAAVIAQEEKIAIESRFAKTDVNNANDKKLDKSFSKFSDSVDSIKKNVSSSSDLGLVNNRKRNYLSSDSPGVEILQEVLELLEDLSYAAARKRVIKGQKNSFTSSKFSKDASMTMTSTSKYALSSMKSNKKAKINKDAENQARLDELKTIHGTIKRALQNKNTISNEQLDKIRKGVVAMRNDIFRELGRGEAAPKLESNKSLTVGAKASM